MKVNEIVNQPLPQNFIERIQNSEFYKKILDKTADGLYLLDAESKKILYANHAICNYLQYSQEEMLTLHVYKIIAHDPSDIESKISKLILTQIPTIAERNYKKKDGTVIQVETVSSMIEFEDRKILVVAVRDISLRKIAYSAIKKSEIQFRSVWENSFDGMRLIDKDGKIVLVNNAFCYLCSKTREELIGKPFSIIYQQDLQENIFLKTIKRFNNRTIQKNVIDEVTLWNGKKVWFELSNSYIDYENDSTLLLSNFRDITLQKEYEIELQQINEELKETSLKKDKFFSFVTHDLKSPFQGLLGLTSILADSNEDFSVEEMRDYSKKVNSIANNLFSLIQDLLNWSRIQSGQMQFNPQKVNLHKIISDCASAVDSLAKNKNLLILNEIDSDIYVLADSVMLVSIIQNLLSNAIKFSFTGGKILIGSNLNKDEIEIFIKDEGIGISQENINKLFQLDQQFSSIGTSGEKGTGLGLLICKQMVEKHGSFLKVVSELSKGSCFSFILKLCM